MDRMEIIGEDFNEPEVGRNATYLGDGLYVEYDGYHIVIYSHDGIAKRDTVYLDANVAACLAAYMKRVL